MLKPTTEQNPSERNTRDKDLEENTYIDATLRALRRAAEDDYKEGKIDEKEYRDLIAILDKAEKAEG